MKRNGILSKTIRVFLGGMFAVSMLAGCSKTATEETASSETITITFMNQDETLGTAEAQAGQVLDASSYEAFENQEGAEFNGWYETPSFLESSKKDLASATFEEDTTLYGDFRNTDIAEDTRKWYIAGTSSKGILQLNNWAADLSDDEKAMFELTATGNATNEFSLTIDLFEGDMFQIIHDWSWDGQKGYGKFTEIDDTQMGNAGGLGGTADTSNVEVLMDGNYTITLTTNPDNQAQDTLTIVRNSDPLTDGAEVEEEPFVISENTTVSVKGSWVSDWSDLKELTREDGTNTYTITFDLDADTELCFSVFEDGTDTGLVLKEENVTEGTDLLAENGNNIQIAETGTYTFTVNLDDMSVEITK